MCSSLPRFSIKHPMRQLMKVTWWFIFRHSVPRNLIIQAKDDHLVPVKRKLITSALPYVNNAPHLGNFWLCAVCRCLCAFLSTAWLWDNGVCGTDGYGTATETRQKRKGPLQKRFVAFSQDPWSVYRFLIFSLMRLVRPLPSAHPNRTEYVPFFCRRLLSKRKEAPFCRSCDKLGGPFRPGTFTVAMSTLVEISVSRVVSYSILKICEARGVRYVARNRNCTNKALI